MQYIQKESSDQITFLPDCIEDYISEDNPVRVIDAFVDSLDLSYLGFSHSSLCDTGRPPYDPADMLKLYIYGYMGIPLNPNNHNLDHKIIPKKVSLLWDNGKLNLST
ncbi:transposase [Clostridiales bacterium BAD-6]|uniref:Transposase n=1 Tax=Sinanaerobacter chloroacetimidivorans TaxID=2818044 RepID=A0A8J7W173_9FIRM|nr:hypothetical protein [Sinanaerobacter chloroacetimidivorans]MBR0597315.1 transposase [Sinanaerobacter chloroacetimidivorans]